MEFDTLGQFLTNFYSQSQKERNLTRKQAEQQAALLDCLKVDLESLSEG